MTENWRYVDSGPQDPFQNIARFPVYGNFVSTTKQPLMITGVWGATHLNVGWFDDVDSTLDLDACRRLGIQVIRRPVMGGGTAYYEKGCNVIWGFMFPKDTHPLLDEDLRRFQPVMLDVLGKLGLEEVGFEGSSDLRWHGRKIGALTGQDAVLCNSIGGFLNIKPPSLELYLQVVRVPEDKFRDKIVKDMREYVVTAEEIAGRPISYEEFRDALIGSLERAGIVLEPRPLTPEEEAGADRLAAQIASDEFVRRISSDRFREAAPPGSRVGFGNRKGRKLCRAGVAVDGSETIVAAMMAGDMHVGPPDTMERIAANLVGAKAFDVAELRARIAHIFESPDVHQPDALMGVTTEDLLAAVRKAVEQACGVRA